MLKFLIHLYRKYFWSVKKLAVFNGATIGKDCDIQDKSFGSEPYLVTIGNHVQITSGTKIFTHGGAWVLRGKYPNIGVFGKVVIKDNVYIGNNCLIMPGVIIGKNCVIGAGSVVTKSIPDNLVVPGNLAKIIASFSEFEQKMILKNTNSKALNALDKKKYLLSLSDDKFVIK